MAKLHWTQTPEGREIARENARKRAAISKQKENGISVVHKFILNIKGNEIELTHPEISELLRQLSAFKSEEVK